LTLGCTGGLQRAGTKPMTSPLLVTFSGGPTGRWRVLQVTAVTGLSLDCVERLEMGEGATNQPQSSAGWRPRGGAGKQRETEGREKDALSAVQAGLGRPEATRAALIPIRKNAAWWALSQDERRAIFEERSHHIQASLRYLPAVARRLHHSRDLGEPLDFLTWF